MPYKLGSPPAKIKGLSAHAQEVWIKAFNAAYANPPKGRDREEYAHRVAWAASKRVSSKRT